jgi:drug/metabolite transporter (DMT)-like permease
MFALVIAHFAFADDRMTPLKVAGVLLSFAGILVLTSRDWMGGNLLSGDLSGEFAIIGASLCYATFTSFSRKVLQKYKIEPVMVSGATMTAATVAAALMMFGAPLIGERGPVSYASLSSDVLISALLLGFLNTFIAYLLYYPVVAHLGASRTSMITYAIPVVAVTLGALILGEVIDGRMVAGALLIVAGIGLANLRFGQLFRRRQAIPVPTKAEGLTVSET